MVFSPGGFLGEADQIGAGYVVVVPNLAASHAAEE
jgi:hypothetical protein